MPSVALGPFDTAGCGSALARALRGLGHDAELAVFERHPFGYPADRVLGRFRRVLYTLALPARRDVVHYQYGSTWLPYALDAWWARLWRRTRVVTYHGDDCRLASVAREHQWPLAPLKDVRGDGAVRARLQRLSRLCDGAIVGDLELASYVRPFFRRVYVAPVPVVPVTPVETQEQRTPVVLHAPSDPAVKGTSSVKAAVKALAERRPLEFRVLAGVPHARVTDEIARANVLVDQLGSTSASVLALEAMSARVPVLSRVDSRALASFHADLPIVAVDETSLAGELDALLGDGERRARLGEAGRAYVLRTHAAEAVAAATAMIYDHAPTAPRGLYEATADGIRRRSEP
jgi:hypothetical protein